MQKIIKNFEQFINESWSPADAYEDGTSNCCGAPIMVGDICSECGEHCESEESDNDWMDDEFDGHEEDHGLEGDHEPNLEDEGHEYHEEEEGLEGMYEAKKAKKAKEEDENLVKGKKPATTSKKAAANAKFPNLKPASMKKGLEKMKGKDFKEKTKKNFSWASNPPAAAASYMRKATGKEPKDI